METIKTFEHRGFTVEIFRDIYALQNESPREWENLGVMLCSHSRYSLGDGDMKTIGDNAAEIEQSLKDEKAVVVLPLYLYDHGEITMNTRGFSCPWDSGQVGIIYVTRDRVEKELGWKRITKQRREKLQEILVAEVEVYDQYLRGEVYCYSWEHGSCGGFYGDVDYVRDEAVSEIDYHIEAERAVTLKEHQKKLKSWIEGNVPIEYRKPCPELV